MAANRETNGQPQGHPDSQDRSGEVTFGYDKVAARDKGRLVGDQFTAIARRYDMMNHLLSFGLHVLWKKRTVAALPLRPGHRVLDVCGGTADLALLAVEKTGDKGGAVVCDINRAMMEAGKEKIRTLPGGRPVSFVQGDAERLPFAPGTFDGVMVGFGIRNLTNMPTGLEEMCRVLKPGGAFVCLEFARPANPFFSLLYDIYSFTIMPAAGKIFAGSRKAYCYLPESIRVFPPPERVKELMTGAGFTAVTSTRLTNGIAVLYRATKP